MKSNMVTRMAPMDMDTTITKQFQKKYLEGVRFFNCGEYYEAHEEWEQVWLKVSGEEKLFYQGLIQTAAALLKMKEGKKTAADGLCKAALAKLSEVSDHYMGLDVRLFEKELKTFFIDLKKAPRIDLRP